MRLAARLLLDLGRVQQGSNGCRRTNANGNAGLHQLGPAFFLGPLGIIACVAHVRLSMASLARLEAA